VTLEEREDIATQLPPDNHLALSINDMDLKHRFRGIETDCLNRMHVPDTLVKGAKIPIILTDGQGCRGVRG